MKLEKGLVGLRNPRVIILLTVLLVASILGVGNLSYRATERATFDEFNQRQLVLAKGTTGGVELYFETLGEEVRAIGRIPEVQRLEETRTREELERWFKEIEPLGVNDVGVLDASGVLMYNVMAHQIEGIDFSWRIYFQEAKKMTPSDETYIIEFIEFKGAEAGQKGVVVAVPMFEEGTNKFAGVVLASLKLDTITQRFIVPVKSSKTGHAFLIDDEYGMLWTPDSSLFGKDIKEESEGFPAFQQILKEMVRGGVGTADYSYYSYDESTGKYTGKTEEKLIAYAPIYLGKETWAIGVWSPKEEARKLIRSAYIQLVVLVGFAILIILLGSLYALSMSSRISRILEKEVETKTRELRDSHERLLTVLNSLDAAVYVADMETYEILFLNKYLQNLFGDVVGKTCWRVLQSGKTGQCEFCTNEKLVNANGEPKGVYQWEIHNTVIDRWYELRDRAIQWVDGRIVRLEIATDITERKLREKQIKASLKEKEALLQEIHHRVKNNMQIISSMLNLQSRQIKDKEDAEIFKESQNRIKSMALIHEKLYQSPDLANIEFGGYIKNLVNGLFRTYGIDIERIALKMDVEKIPLKVDAAIPCGLLINELVTNSLKHAFPKGREGEIEIVLRGLDGDKIELVVSDNGVGIPEGLDYKKVDSLGMHLINTLVNQLQGEIKLDRTKGTRFQIKFRGGG